MAENLVIKNYGKDHVHSTIHDFLVSLVKANILSTGVMQEKGQMGVSKSVVTIFDLLHPFIKSK